MTTKLAPAKKKPDTTLALIPKNFREWMQLADSLAKSSLVPKDFREKPGDCLVAMQMGASVGLNPFQAIQSIAVINGRPCMWGDAVLGIVMASGLLEDIDETDDGKMATCTVKRKGKPTPVVRTFSMQDATAAKVYERDGQGGGKWVALAERAVWRSYPKRMRQMRARSWALRDAFPDVLKGLAIREEVEDYGDEPQEPKTVGGQTLEERMADLMPKEKAPDEPAQTPPADEAGPPAAPAPPAAHEAPEVLPAAEPAVAPPPAPKRLTFTVGQQTFETNGITRGQMMELFKLYPRVSKKYGAEKAADVLRKEFSLEHRADLTEEQAERYTIRLQEMIE